jgi:hypothetical protein
MFRDRSSFRVRGARINVQPPGFFGRVLAVIAGLVLFVLGLMFSVVIIAVAVAAGLIIWGWIWWKTRPLRRQMREQMEARMAAGGDTAAPAADDEGRAPSGRVIEGEVIRADDPPRSHLN